MSTAKAPAAPSGRICEKIYSINSNKMSDIWKTKKKLKIMRDNKCRLSL